MGKDDVIKTPGEDNAFGILNPTHEEPDEEGKEGKEPKKEEGKSEGEKPEGEETPPEGEETSKKEGEEETPEGEEKPDETLTALIEKSPEVKELVEKKGFKSVADIVKTYNEMVGRSTRAEQQRSAYREILAPYVKFDEDGNPIGYTDVGQRLVDAGTSPQKEPAGPEREPLREPSGDVGQAPDFGKLNEKFWEQFEKNPLDVLTKMITAVVMAKDRVVGGKKGFRTGSGETFQPSGGAMNDQMRGAIVDSAIVDLQRQGDAKASEFFDKYGDEIAAEMNKFSPALLRTNPRTVVLSAYYRVKDRKVRELQGKLTKKQKEEAAKAAALANTGDQTAGGGKPSAEPEFAEMEKNLEKQPESVFFGG